MIHKQTNMPIIKIKYNNSKDDKKSKYVYYNFEEIEELTIFMIEEWYKIQNYFCLMINYIQEMK